MKAISLEDYKKLYYDNKKCIPGEHHFVAVYLLNKFNRIPDYINPDGTKKKCGDIVFENENGKSFSIEVKVGKPSFTFSKNETNDWFVDKNEPCPNYIIVLTKNYLFIIVWKNFIKSLGGILSSKRIKKGNSKSISEEILLKNFKDNSFKIEFGIDKTIEEIFDKINMEIEDIYK